ncbi:MAG: alpha/beta hydrolase [Proteobacteria bacterium]|nr:alpha/beta hydrolase [Pseudomonadota bacterium]
MATSEATSTATSTNWIPDRREDLGLVLHEQLTPEPFGDARCWRFEFSSRGDRVPGRLLVPPTSAAPPLLLFQHGIGGRKEAPYMEAASRWVAGGAAVASIDFPLHGERESAKLSEQLIASGQSLLQAANDEAPAPGLLLWREFVRQSVLDLGRALDALEAVPGQDFGPRAYAGFSLGGILGARFCAVDTRPVAAALALAGGGWGPPELDPCGAVADIAPRPLLFVNGTRDERIPKSAAEALHAAAGEPKRVEWFDCGHNDLPGQALKAMWQFLRDHLGLGSCA